MLGALGFLAASVILPPVHVAVAQPRETIPWSLFGSSDATKEDAPAQETVPPEQPERLPVPMPPRRPAGLADTVPTPVQAEPPRTPAAAPMPVEEKPAEVTHTPFGSVYRSLGSEEFVPFVKPEPVPLQPKQSGSKAARPAHESAGAGTIVSHGTQPPPEQAAPVAEPRQPPFAVQEDPAQSGGQPVAHVPLPPPAPANRGEAAAPAVPAEQAPGQPQNIAPPPSVAAVPPPAALPPVSTLTDRQIVERANRFFNTLETMQANFVQIGGDGKRMTGILYLERPGRVRFAYNPPATMEIISDGKSVAIRDSKLNTSDVYSINQTPLKFLLRDPINLASDLKLVEIERDPTGIQITLEDGSTIGGTAQITLFFDSQMQNLTRWQIYDAQGFTTTVILSQVQRTRRGG